MIVDSKMLDIIRELHKELPVLSYEELLEIKKLISSPDAETVSIGQSMLYFSNFFERPMSITYILSHNTNLNEDGKTLQMLLHALNSTNIDEDIQIFNKLQHGNDV